MIANKTTCYEQILRAIGQGLEVLSVQAFDLEVDGKNYVVQGQTSKRGKVPKPHHGFKNAFHHFWYDSQNRSSTRDPREKPSSPFVFLGRQFAQEDIDRLERQGQILRSGTEGSPNPHSLSQVLRMIGAYVDHKRGRLSKVSGRNQWVTIWSRGPTGGEHMERFTQSNLHDLWVHRFKQR